MKLPTEGDFNSRVQLFITPPLEIVACPIVENPRAYIKEFVSRMIEREKELGNPEPEINNCWIEPKDHLTLMNDFILKDIKEESIEKSFISEINTFDCLNEDLIKVVKKYKSVKFFYTWLEALKIVEKAIIDNVLNGNNYTHTEGIDHLEVYFKIGKEELKIDAQRFQKDAMPGHEYQLNMGIEPAFFGMCHNMNTIAFSKIPKVKI